MRSEVLAKYIAHTANEAGEEQPLDVHLRAVAQKAASFADAFGGAAEARVAGVIHDLGKFRDEFQGYLRKERGKGIDTHHAPYGAAFAFNNNWLCAFAIAGHHAGLHNVSDLQTLLDPSGPYRLASRLPELQERFVRIVAQLPADVSLPVFLQGQGPSELDAEFYIRMLFSCLVDADYLDTEEHSLGHPRITVKLADVCSGLLNRVLRERESKPASGRVNQVRHRIFDQCLSAADQEQGFYSLTVPTGGGKTLSSMAFALAHAKKWGLEHVIAVIPYLSIIEQNAAEYRRILDPANKGLVVEHHSAVPVTEDDNQPQSSSAQKAAENWDAPIVVTTSVQFIESLFASSPSKCRKLHNVAKSMVVMDEVQTLPVHLLEPLLNVLRQLRKNYGTSFLFLTATQPGFRHDAVNLREGFRPGEVREITERTGEIFQVLKRVKFKHLGTLDWNDLASKMSNYPQVLAVVNVRKHAFTLWSTLRDCLPEQERDSLFHLSSAMCAEHRLHTIGKITDPRAGSIRDRLARGLPCRVVATQVVEAGVDFDFPAVFRALGPLDSIIQAGGRCNREGRLVNEHGEPVLGDVFVFVPEEHALPPGIYKTATEHTAVFLERLESFDLLFSEPSLFGNYFSEVVQVADTDFRRGRESTIQEDRESLRFRDVSRKARVIEDEGTPVAVPYAQARDIVARFRDPGEGNPGKAFNYAHLRALQRFMVNLRRRDLQKALTYGVVTQLTPDVEVMVLEEGCYHEDLGVLIEERPTEDFVQ